MKHITLTDSQKTLVTESDLLINLNQEVQSLRYFVLYIVLSRNQVGWAKRSL